MMTPPLKISFCTVCMNRLHHLKQTLPANLKNNRSYANLEFVLLDYNSSDGLAYWIESELQEYIRSGRLVYYKTNEPTYFHRSHSRNMVFKLATGDILCNIDADNFTGENFAQYINDQFTFDNNVFVAADTSNRHYFIRDVCGRISCWKKDFDAVGGFDEQMEGYGDEDIDLINRLRMLGRQEVVILDSRFLNAIFHSDLERVQNEFTMANLVAVYISHLTPYTSSILLLFTDDVLNTGTIIDNVMQNAVNIPTLENSASVLSPNDRYALGDLAWNKGAWRTRTHAIDIELNEQQQTYRDEGSLLRHEPTGQTYFKVTDKTMIVEVINFYSRMKNVARLTSNRNSSLMVANEKPIGVGAVVKNFNTALINV
jgi:hypothetical protein